MPLMLSHKLSPRWKCVTHHTTTCLVSNFVGVAWRHLMLKRSMQHYSALVWTYTNTEFILQESLIQYLASSLKNQQLEQINVQRKTIQWWLLPGVFMGFGILWSLRPLPCLPGYQHYLPASSSISKTQQNSASTRMRRERHTLFVIISFQPSYHQIIKPVESTLHSH